MFRPLELFVGLRYTRTKRRTHFISFITLTSMLGIALGVTALITVLSVMNGFETELRTRILGMASHATISRYDGRLDDWQSLASLVENQPHVLASAPYVSGESMLSNGQQVSGAILRGVDPALEGRVSDVVDHIRGGDIAQLTPGGYGIILGSELAAALGVGAGDAITVVSPQITIAPTGVLPRLRRFTVLATFEVGMYEYDRGVALVHMEDAAKLFRLDGAVSGLRLKIDDVFDAPMVVRQLAAQLPGDYRLEDWSRKHANFFRAVKTEKRVMFIILTLIVAVAAFNIVSTLIMVVTDKRSDIAILRTLGVTPRSIMMNLHHPGCRDRRTGHGAGRGRRGGAGPEHRVHRAGHRAAVQCAVPGGGRVLHQRSTFRTALERRVDHGLGGIAAEPAGDAVPGLARGAHTRPRHCAMSEVLRCEGLGKPSGKAVRP